MSSRPSSFRLLSSRPLFALRAAGLGSALLTLAGLAIVSPASAAELHVGQYGTSLSGTATITSLGTTASGTFQYYLGVTPSPLDPTQTNYVYLRVYGPSTVNLNGGTVQSYLDSYDTSTVYVSSGGGPALGLTTHDASTATLTGGLSSNLTSYDTSRLYISGGNGSNISTHDTSTAQVSGGSFDNLASANSSLADVSGGSFRYLASIDSATVNVTGGSFSSFVESLGTSTINLFGTGFSLTPLDDSQKFQPGLFGSVPQFRVQGTLQDGEPLNVYYIQQGGQLVLHDPVPEASSVVSFGLLLCLGLGGLAISKRRRKAQSAQ